ncbi:MAG: hypothetical protein ACOX5J_06660 [Candidatus Hydrogenedentales bacterium]|jgi:hypothetical protein
MARAKPQCKVLPIVVAMVAVLAMSTILSFRAPLPHGKGLFWPGCFLLLAWSTRRLVWNQEVYATAFVFCALVSREFAIRQPVFTSESWAFYIKPVFLLLVAGCVASLGLPNPENPASMKIWSRLFTGLPVLVGALMLFAYVLLARFFALETQVLWTTLGNIVLVLGSYFLARTALSLDRNWVIRAGIACAMIGIAMGDLICRLP